VADNTLATWQPFLLEKQGHVYEVFPSEAVFLAEMSGYSSSVNDGRGGVDQTGTVQRVTREMDGNRETFSGKYVKHVIITAGLPGGGQVQEVSVWNQPHALPTSEVHINLVRTLVPFSVTVDVERDSMDAAMATAVETLIDQARSACARLENLQMLNDGTGLMAQITDAASSLTTTVPVPPAAGAGNFDVLLPGTVWDILTRSTGADPGQGLRRKIQSVNEATGVITWLTAQQAGDGGSGAITHAATEGIYIPGSWSNGTPGTPTAPGALVAQGLVQAAANTGTFETVDKAAAGAWWWGTDGRGGDTSALPLSAQMMDGGIRRGRRSGLGKWDFGLGDPACIDLYKQGLYASVRYDPQVSVLKSGFTGIMYDGADAPFPLVKDPTHPKNGIKLIDKASFQIYGDAPGPQFLQDDGSTFRRFTRTLAKEADFLDRWQLGVGRCNTIVYFNSLTQAA
jgi:hypothetical protein